MDQHAILRKGVLVHENDHQSPVGLRDSTYRDKMSFGNDVVTDGFDIDIMFGLVGCLYDTTDGTSNATISAAINKGTMVFKMRQ
jgi:hypothetical protein